MNKKVTQKDIDYFLKSYVAGESLYSIFKKTGFNPCVIKLRLKKSGVQLREDKFSKSKKGFSDAEKNKIIDLYIRQKRGAKYIGELFGKSETNITYWLNKWNVPKNTRSEISLKIREVYGATKGFTGFKHNKKSKKQISLSGKKAWEDEDRVVKSSKSRTYETIIGDVLGTYEVAYLQSLLDNKQTLPNINKKRYKTPYGSYTPDFEFEDRFVEIKSEFTIKVSKGIINYKNGEKSKQWKKIEWLNKNLKKVEVIVLKQKDVKILFDKACKTKMIKNGK